MCCCDKQSVTIAKRLAIRPRLESVLAKLWLVLDVKTIMTVSWTGMEWLHSLPALTASAEIEVLWCGGVYCHCYLRAMMVRQVISVYLCAGALALEPIRCIDCLMQRFCVCMFFLGLHLLISRRPPFCAVFRLLFVLSDFASFSCLRQSRAHDHMGCALTAT